MAKNRWTDAVLDPARLMGDPLADDLIGPLLESGSAAQVSATLAQIRTSHAVINEELPIDVEEYLEVSAQLPSWADTDKLEAAEDFFGRAGFPVVIGLFCYSLPEAYAAEKGAQVLAQTGRPRQRRPPADPRDRPVRDRRHGSRRAGTGRGRHPRRPAGPAHARRHPPPDPLPRTPGRARARDRGRTADTNTDTDTDTDTDGRWNHAWGRPINQEDLVATELSFAVTATEALPKLWYEVSEDDAEAFLHAWKVVGHLLGVREDLQPVDVADAADLAAAVRRRQFGPSPAGTELTEALIELLDELDAGEHLPGMNRTMIRHLVGDETADVLGIGPPARTYGLFTVMKVAMRITSRHTSNNRILGLAAESLGRSVLNGIFDYQRRDLGEVTFAIPETLADRWHIHPGQESTIDVARRRVSTTIRRVT